MLLALGLPIIVGVLLQNPATDWSLWDAVRDGFDRFMPMGPGGQLGMLQTLVGIAVAATFALMDTVRRGQTVARLNRGRGRRNDALLVRELRLLDRINGIEWLACHLFITACILLTASYWRYGGDGWALNGLTSASLGAWIFIQMQKVRYSTAFAHDVRKADRTRIEHAVEQAAYPLPLDRLASARWTLLATLTLASGASVIALLPVGVAQVVVMGLVALIWFGAAIQSREAAVAYVFQQRLWSWVGHGVAYTFSLLALLITGLASTSLRMNDATPYLIYLGIHTALFALLTLGFAGRGLVKTLHVMTMLAAEKRLVASRRSRKPVVVLLD
ncbi:hypothetical protein GCM10010413_19960 [Promicromonospora sukumoe]|uniref:Uncharacterized protein n=1 Tax=Promicromonospora sukumoe TaxID=88382 RepID=A0A7W3J9L1_9MICO|nr:hypothetical protein [Promicromonospora sukumoe]MBA8808786.1 hypothetical protein [Promicromonospora sukumoe]